MKSIGFNHQLITSEMIYMLQLVGIIFAKFLLIIIGTQNKQLATIKARLLLNHLFLFFSQSKRKAHHFMTIFRMKCVTVYDCSLIFIASKFTPFGLAWENEHWLIHLSNEIDFNQLASHVERDFHFCYKIEWLQNISIKCQKACEKQIIIWHLIGRHWHVM